ncbi:MAG TPA: hypothetical protein VLM91_02270 [Candidatus Methylomirabilis sp.]|nr:hypothetical protein [Candidatus Methylomirabilis sp.]
MQTTTLKRWISLAVLAYATFSASSAFAQAQGLAAVGPTDPADGYPAWYQDTTGLQLAQCLVSPSDPAPVPDPCALTGTLPNDGAPVVFPSNFPNEFFYWRGVSKINGVGAGGGGRASLILGLEGAFGGPTATVADGNGAQIVFSRLRIVANGLTPGATYSFTHPYGVTRLVADSKGQAKFTDDFGCLAAPCNFSAVLPTHNVGPFLTWDPAVPPAAPAGFIGDPNVTHAITGSPFGTNVFQVDGPNAGGAGINTISTDQFAITGKVFTP